MAREQLYDCRRDKGVFLWIDVPNLNKAELMYTINAIYWMPEFDPYHTQYF